MRAIALACALAAAPAAAQEVRDALAVGDLICEFGEGARRSAIADLVIERVGPSVRGTTLIGCERRTLRRGAQTCGRFSARYAWHFDESALSDPDRAFAELPAGTMAGRCEPWQLD